jgi:hypothetical protein
MEFADWDDILILFRDIQIDDNIIIIMSRKNQISYQNSMNKIHSYLNKYSQKVSFILVYPMQIIIKSNTNINLKKPSILEPIEKLDEIGKTIAKLFQRK